MYFFLLLASLIAFGIFKFETAFYLLMTDNYNKNELYQSFDIIFGLVICLRILSLWGRIWYQCNIDIFFLDRETVKQESDGSPNAWRLIFVANEYNEMQNSQYISVEYTLLWFNYFMVGEGWEGWAAQDPDFNEFVTDSWINHYLKFSIICILLLSIGFVQIMMKRIFSFLVPLDMDNFVDLCSITNISVFIFDQRIHGYYIHGVSPWGEADVTLKELDGFLVKEMKGESTSRGLLSTNPNLQTFEIYLPIKIRQIYEVVYKQPVLNEISTYRQNVSAIQNSSSIFSLAALPKGLNIQSLVNQRDEVSQYFINYVSQVKNYPSIAVKERGLCQMFSNLPPDELNNKETPIFLKDYWKKFQSVFFGALDLDILILFSCIYMVLDLWELNFMQSTIIIYTYYKIFIEYPRRVLSSRNLATKSLVESRFLM
jgi:meckelin